MKKFFSSYGPIIFPVFLVMALLAPTLVSAQADVLPGAGGQTVEGVSIESEAQLADTLEGIFAFIRNFVFILAAIMFLIGGAVFVFGGASESARGSAKNFVVYALIGVAVALVAQGVVLFVRDIIGI